MPVFIPLVFRNTTHGNIGKAASLSQYLAPQTLTKCWEILAPGAAPFGKTTKRDPSQARECTYYTLWPGNSKELEPRTARNSKDRKLCRRYRGVPRGGGTCSGVGGGGHRSKRALDI